MKNLFLITIIFVTTLIIGCEDNSEYKGLTEPEVLQNINNYSYILSLTYTDDGYNLIIFTNDASQIDTLNVTMDSEEIPLTEIDGVYYHNFSSLVNGHNYNFEIYLNGENRYLDLRMVNVFSNFEIIDQSIEEPKFRWELENNNLVQLVNGSYYKDFEYSEYEIYIEPSQRSFRFPKKDSWQSVSIGELNYSVNNEFLGLSITAVTCSSNKNYNFHYDSLDEHLEKLKNRYYDKIVNKTLAVRGMKNNAK